MNENIDSLRREHNQRLVDLLVSTGQEPSGSYAMNYLLTSIHLNRRDTEAMCEVAMLRIVADELSALVRVRTAAQEIIDWQDTGPRQQPISVLAKELAPRIDKLRAALLQEKEIGK